MALYRLVDNQSLSARRGCFESPGPFSKTLSVVILDRRRQEKKSRETQRGVAMQFNLFRAWMSARFHLGEHDERGANLVEYILLIAFIAIIVIIAVKVLGRTVSTKFSSANSNLQ
jgi:Flp pilus assembly pilin Flp